MVQLKTNIYLLLLVILLGPLSGLAQAESDEATKRLSLKLITFNIRSGVLGLKEIAQELKDLNPDIVFLQEIHGKPLLPSLGNQAAFLGDELALNVFFAKAQVWVSGEYGLTILSRFPFVEKNIHPLPNLPKEENKVLMEAVVETPLGPLALYNAHYIARAHHDGNSGRKLRFKQAQETMRIVNQQKLPVILGGDLNAFGISRVKRLFKKSMVDIFKEKGKGRNSTFPVGFAILRLDYLWAKDNEHIQIKPIISRVRHVKLSDHKPVTATVELIEIKPREP